MPTVVSRIFMNGNSQAVRIPLEFRLDASRVEISRNEQGDLVIHLVPVDRGSALVAALALFADPLGQTFVAALEDDQREASAYQEREAL